MLSSSLLLAGLTGFAGLSSASVISRQSGTSAYYTKGDGSVLLKQVNAPVKGSASVPSGGQSWNLNFDDTSSGYKQTINGFGAALTDGSVTAINSLSSSVKANLFNDLFTTSQFNLMRHTIGSSDMSADPGYTYDDNGGNADPNMNGFNLGDRGNAMANMLAAIKKYSPSLKILGSPWSPPGWMKLNGDVVPTQDKDSIGKNNLRDHYVDGSGPDYSSAFAQYFVKYIKAFKALNAAPDYITIQNEPYNSQAGYPTMYMFDQEMANLIQNYVGPALSSLGTKIWTLDHNTKYSSHADLIINNAGQYTQTVAWHCYENPDYSVLSSFHSKHPNVDQYMTECIIPNNSGYNWGNDAYSPANWTMGPLQNWAKGSIAWNLAAYSGGKPYLSTGGCQGQCPGMVTIDPNSNSYTLDLSYYVLSQFSRSMPRGATVLNGGGSYTFGDGTGVEAIATVNPDKSRTVVMVNKSDSKYYTTVKFKSGDSWNAVLPSNSIMTWTLPSN